MSESANAPNRPATARPLSPFMIGPYYKPQLTSMTSITHRITGLILVAGTLGLLYWLTSVAAGPDAHAQFRLCADSIWGKALQLAFVWALFFHLLNGIRHLFWDAGKGLDIKAAYASGWAVILGSLVLTILVLLCGGVA